MRVHFRASFLNKPAPLPKHFHSLVHDLLLLTHGALPLSPLRAPLLLVAPLRRDELRLSAHKAIQEAKDTAALPPPALELRRTDFARMSVAAEPRAAAAAALRKYGCGTCGPRAF